MRIFQEEAVVDISTASGIIQKGSGKLIGVFQNQDMQKTETKYGI